MITPEVRAAMMRAVKSRDTKPEMTIRRMLHRLGYRYRLHRKELPGKPDIVFYKRKKILFVNGCFWHKHQDCQNVRIPKSHAEYWKPKLDRNVERDVQAITQLQSAGWSVLTVWECEVSKNDLSERILSFLGQPRIS